MAVKWDTVGQRASQGATAGATAGSFIPVVGQGVGALIGGLLGSGEGLIESSIPTEQERDNNAKLAELKRRESEGKLGLTDQERRQIDRSTMDPVRKSTTELATAQPVDPGADAASIARDRQMQQQVIADAAGASGARMADENMAKKKAEQAEIEQRLAFKTATTKDRQHELAQTVSEAAAAAATYAAEPPMDVWGPGGTRLKSFKDVDSFLADPKLGLSSEDQAALKELARRDPKRFAKFMEDQGANYPAEGAKQADEYTTGDEDIYGPAPTSGG